jgi:hypothetical protein
MSRILTPRPDPADEVRVSKLMLTIGGRRYEITDRIEVREIVNGPAEVIAMPPPAKTELP